MSREKGLLPIGTITQGLVGVKYLKNHFNDKFSYYDYLRNLKYPIAYIKLIQTKRKYDWSQSIKMNVDKKV